MLQGRNSPAAALLAAVLLGGPMMPVRWGWGWDSGSWFVGKLQVWGGDSWVAMERLAYAWESFSGLNRCPKLLIGFLVSANSFAFLVVLVLGSVCVLSSDRGSGGYI